MDGVSDTTQASILERLQEIFRAELDDDDLTIGIDTRQVDLKAWDSLAHIRIVSGIEGEFDFQFNLAEIEEINSVRQFVDAIREHIQARKRRSGRLQDCRCRCCPGCAVCPARCPTTSRRCRPIRWKRWARCARSRKPDGTRLICASLAAGSGASSNRRRRRLPLTRAGV